MRWLGGILGMALIGLAVWGCSGSSTSAVDPDEDTSCTSGTDVTETVTLLHSGDATAAETISCTTNISPDAPDWIKDNFHCVTVKACSSTYVFVTNDLPPYKTGYYSVASGNNTTFPTTGNSDGSTRTKNPNTISSQSITMTIPKTPTAKTANFSTTSGSGLDCLGLTTYGVCIFNNQAAPGDSLATEFQTMDNGDGHPQNTGKYHHHTEPYYLSDDDSNLIGVMMDGYPVYGKKSQDNSVPTLDATTHTVACTTTEFPDGTFCYHVDNGTGVDAYMIGSSFKGEPGTVE